MSYSNVDCFVYFKEAGDYKITVFLTESGIIGRHYAGNGQWISDYQFNDTVLGSLTAVDGNDIMVSTPRTELKEHYSIHIPTDYDREQLKVLVYIKLNLKILKVF